MSNNGDLWLKHLAVSLKASRQVASLWHVDDDRYEFMGDIFGVFGVADSETPKNKDKINALINPQDLVSRQMAITEALAKAEEGDAEFTTMYKIKRRDGTNSPVIETGTAHFDKNTGKRTVQSFIMLDTKTIEQNIKILKRAEVKDNVTHAFAMSGNMGRSALEAQLSEYLTAPRRDLSRGYLLAVGIDRMSLLNEAYGSQIADEILHRVGKRLEALAGDLATVTRVNGDLFSVLVRQGAHTDMQDIAHSILKVFYHQPFDIGGKIIHAMVSIGGVVLDTLDLKPSSAISRAEMALRDAKQAGRGCFINYSEKNDNDTKDMTDVLAIGDQFLRSFRDGRVRLAYQKIVNAKTHEATFYECLIRMIDDNGKTVPAGLFIGAVEKMGLTRLVDGFCTMQAIKELKMFPEIRLSVNVSNHTLTDPQWLKDVSNELRDQKSIASRLIVEITESVAMNDVNQTLRVIRTLQDLGCKVALDDFGAGATAFTQLRDLSIDIVKIDKSFVRAMDKTENMLFISALQSLAKGMNIITVAEGAETLEEAQILTDCGIDHIQGYAFSMPTMERIWLPKEHDLRDPLAHSKQA